MGLGAAGLRGFRGRLALGPESPGVAMSEQVGTGREGAQDRVGSWLRGGTAALQGHGLWQGPGQPLPSCSSQGPSHFPPG